MTESRQVRSATGQEDIATVSGTLGHYQIGECIGEGGYGEVYRAWDHKLCRNVAIKRIKNLKGAARSHDLAKEARLAASLGHAAFVKVHAIEDDGDSQSIVMELVAGETLSDILRRGSIDRQHAIGWVAQIAEAMQEAHASGLVHGDLKPSNLIVEPAGKIRILDFGLATRNDLLATMSIEQLPPQGTIAYMAPERLHGAPLEARADIYALGVILYELMCGRRPYAGLNGLALAAAQVQNSSDSWDYPANLQPLLIQLIRFMTARQPQQRLNTMEQVCRHIDALGHPAAATPPPRRLPPRATTRAALAAALLLGAGWQLAPYATVLQRTMRPYSAALEMQQGLAALKLYDRPGNLEEAGGHFERVLAHNPGHAAAVAGLSMVYSLRFVGDRQDEIWLHKADAAAQQAISLDANLALAHIATGWVLDNQGKYVPALQTFEQALRLDPVNYFAWHGKALALRHARNYPQAMEHAQLALQRFPGEQVFSNELGTLHYEQGAYPAAEQAFRRSIAMQPDAVFAYANLNAVLLKQNRGDEALQVLQQGLQVRPSAKLYGNLGNALFLRGDYVGAATAFEHAVSPTTGAPGEYLNWANLADTLLWIPGRAAEARDAYDKAMRLLAPRLERAPNDVTLLSRTALYAARVGKQRYAQSLLGKAVALAPNSADVQFRAGLAYELLGNRADALAAIAKAKQSGYPEKFIDAEPDLVQLRRDPAYR